LGIFTESLIIPSEDAEEFAVLDQELKPSAVR
jgi:hypothetical protein